METIELSGIIGMIAMVVLTKNMIMGMMLSTQYRKSEYFKKIPEKYKLIKIIDLHNYTAYIALVLVLTHIILIPLDPSSKFSFIHIITPWNAPHQPYAVLLGTISLFAILLVILTTQKVIKKKLGYKTWKNIHLISYLTSVLFVIHGLLMDPLLKDRPVDWIDPEKMLAELCGLAIIITTYLRYKYHLQSK